MNFVNSVDDLAGRVGDGALVAMPPEYSWVSMAMTRALIAKGVRDLHVLCVPIGGMAVDMLVGAGCVGTLEAAAVSLGEAGLAPRFTAAIQDAAIEMRDSTCPAVHAGLQASEKGVPFMPLGGLIGSDIEKYRADWTVVDDPTGRGQGPIVLIPAIRPDFAVFHSPRADRDGNVWIGKRRELMTMAHAARDTLVTVEEVVDDDFLADDTLAAGTLPNLYVSGVAEARAGAWPLALKGSYDADRAEISRYAAEARTEPGFEAYLEGALAAARPDAAE
ncbi:MAG: CoA synthetase [Magnetovibrio sp.]|nr:CoA synthetase [Magnetovibrio sp.]